MASSTSHVISLGGSILNPDGIDEKFLKGFCSIVRARVKAGERFAIFTGGGSLARRMQAVARANKGTETLLDELGIEATRINARCLADALGAGAIMTAPDKKVALRGVIVGGGWKPGASTDHCAVSFALANRIGTVVNISNTNFVYDKDPAKFPSAKPLSSLSWAQMRSLVGDTWKPGMNVPFDPIATKLASSKKLRVVFLGPNLANIRRYLQTGKFTGSLIDQ